MGNHLHSPRRGSEEDVAAAKGEEDENYKCTENGLLHTLLQECAIV